jgi:hypothetical protein
LARDLHVKVCLAVPVFMCGQVIGVMAFFSSSDRIYNSSVYEAATNVANALSIALTVRGI